MPQPVSHTWILADTALHAPHPESTPNTLKVLCECTTVGVSIPTVFDRLYTRRCEQCCHLVGIPNGDGSPRNDKTIRGMLDITVEMPQYPNPDEDDEDGNGTG